MINVEFFLLPLPVLHATALFVLSVQYFPLSSLSISYPVIHHVKPPFTLKAKSPLLTSWCYPLETCFLISFSEFQSHA